MSRPDTRELEAAQRDVERLKDVGLRLMSEKVSAENGLEPCQDDKS